MNMINPVDPRSLLDPVLNAPEHRKQDWHGQLY